MTIALSAMTDPTERASALLAEVERHTNEAFGALTCACLTREDALDLEPFLDEKTDAYVTQFERLRNIEQLALHTRIALGSLATRTP